MSEGFRQLVLIGGGIMVIVMVAGWVWFVRWHTRTMKRKMHRLLWPLADAVFQERDAGDDVGGHHG